MQIVDNRALKLRVRDPSRITNIIPKSAVLKTYDNGKSDVLVNWGFTEAVVLRNLGFKNVPTPIVRKYEWPGIFNPMNHQIVTSNFLTMHRRAYCFNEQGTAKTACVAWAADYLMKIGEVKRVLIICPMSTMHTVWVSDLFKTVMHRRVTVAHGSKAKRLAAINSDADFVIINPDGVPVVRRELSEAGFDLVVLDEATCVKNAQTRRWRTINTLVANPGVRLWMLTGTPASQSPLDAYGLARMMDRSTAPRTYTGWRDQVMTQVSNFKWLPREGWKSQVYGLLQPAVRFTKEECLDLPEILYTSRYVPLTSQQQAGYDTMRIKMRLLADTGEAVTAANAAVAVSKLLQICAGSTYTDREGTADFDIKPRFNELRDIIDNAQAKTLVFVPYTNTIDRLQQMLADAKYESAIIDGRVSAGKRAAIIDRFQQEDGLRVLILQPQAIAHGVTLHAANTIVWWGPVTSNETYQQANARIHRKGQRNPCLVVNLEGSAIERKRYKALMDMADNQQSLLELYKDIITS